MENKTKRDPYRYIRTKYGHKSLVKSGKFKEFHPELTGNWDKDKITIELTK